MMPCRSLIWLSYWGFIRFGAGTRIFQNKSNSIAPDQSDSYVARTSGSTTVDMYINEHQPVTDKIIAPSECWMSGHQGNCLLLAVVKQSLPFALINGASQYATFRSDLLYQHACASPFHQKQKTSLFSMPCKGSKTNFALDAIREMEHRDAVKGFRPGAEVSAVLPRMSLVDTFNDIEMKKSENSESPPDATEDPLKLQLSKTDYLHVHRAVSLLLRQGGLSSEPCMVPQNVYDNTRATDLLTTTLDNNTLNVGEYLVMKHACKEGQFGLCTHDLPDAQTLAGPTTQTKKALKKSAMITRVNTTDLRSMKSTLREVSEIKRLRKIKKSRLKQIVWVLRWTHARLYWNQTAQNRQFQKVTPSRQQFTMFWPMPLKVHKLLVRSFIIALQRCHMRKNTDQCCCSWVCGH